MKKPVAFAEPRGLSDVCRSKGGNLQARHLILSAILGLAGAAAQSATLPAGAFGCYTYNPKALFVGEIVIAEDRHTVARFNTSGTYSFDAGSGKVIWRGQPPFGFKAAAFPFGVRVTIPGGAAAR